MLVIRTKHNGLLVGTRVGPFGLSPVDSNHPLDSLFEIRPHGSDPAGMERGQVSGVVPYIMKNFRARMGSELGSSSESFQ
jgi:hypothetical protein